MKYVYAIRIECDNEEDLATVLVNEAAKFDSGSKQLPTHGCSSNGSSWMTIVEGENPDG